MKLFRVICQITFVIIAFGSCSHVEVLDENKLQINNSGDFRIEVATSNYNCDQLSVIYLFEVGSDGSYAKRHTYQIDPNSISEDCSTAEFTGVTLSAGKEYVAYNALYSGVILTATYYDIYALCCSTYGYDLLSQSSLGEQMQSEMVEYVEQELPHFDLERMSSMLELSITLEESSDYQGELESLTIESSFSEDIFLTSVLYNSYREQVNAFGSDGTQYGVASAVELTMDASELLSSSTSIKCNVPLSWNSYITEPSGDFSFTLTTSDGKQCSVSSPIELLTAGDSYPLELTFGNPMDELDLQRAALIDLYNSTNGDEWRNKTNWCSDKDLSEWYGLTLLSSGFVDVISLEENNLSGELAESIGDFICLSKLQLANNNISGSIPSSVDNLETLQYIYLSGNRFSGSIPTSITSLDSWNQLAWSFVEQQSGYGFDGDLEVYLESSALTTNSGEAINSSSLFSDNKLTCVVSCGLLDSDSVSYIEQLGSLYETYHDAGFEILSLCADNIAQSYDLAGYCCSLSGDDSDYSDGTNRVKYMPTSSSLTFAFVNRNGKVLFNESLYPITGSLWEAAETFVDDYFDQSATEDELYYSKDYSLDGSVTQLQTSTTGNGIDIVIMGDGFTDLDMDSGGEYERRMGEAMEHFFSEEPYTTLRDRYNVYSVKAVSKNEGITDDGQTALGCALGSGTYISGSNNTVFSYALKVPSISSVSNVTIIVILNSYRYAGTCYMYSSEAAIAYCPIVYNNDEYFRQIVAHEAGGHGFAKLADEYYYSSTVSDEMIEYYQRLRALGWYANVDVTGEESEILWSHFLSDSRYENLVGIYEGALTYQYGAYRPTEYSIMRYNTGGYNAPSREEIYRRTMELSGEEYSYEKFVAYDAINISAAAQTRSAEQSSSIDESQFVPLNSPIVIFDTTR